MVLACAHSGNFKKGYQFLEQYPETRLMIDADVLHKLYKAHWNIFRYYAWILARAAGELSFYGSLFVVVVWLFVLFRLNIFDVPLYGSAFTAFLVGLFTAFFLQIFCMQAMDLYLLKVLPGSYTFTT